MNLIFELTNEQRKYLGLIPVEENWELVKFDDNIYHYFEGDTIKKEITVSKNYYHESELNEQTAENRTMILPKTKRGKIKKFNYTAVQSFLPFLQLRLLLQTILRKGLIILKAFLKVRI